MQCRVLPDEPLVRQNTMTRENQHNNTLWPFAPTLVGFTAIQNIKLKIISNAIIVSLCRVTAWRTETEKPVPKNRRWYFVSCNMVVAVPGASR